MSTHHLERCHWKQGRSESRAEVPESRRTWFRAGSEGDLEERGVTEVRESGWSSSQLDQGNSSPSIWPLSVSLPATMERGGTQGPGLQKVPEPPAFFSTALSTMG